MASTFKCMLAATLKTTDGLDYTCLVASPKLDGVRCVVRKGVAYSRSNKPIPNKYVQAYFSDGSCDNYDGELIVGPPTAKDVFRVTTSAVMRVEGEPDFHFFVFDVIGRGSYLKRFLDVDHSFHTRVSVLTQIDVDSENALLLCEKEFLAAGYEGVMVRDVRCEYKHGRATLKERGLMKLKRFYDAEATLVGVIELQHNHNTQTVSETGSIKRSSTQAGKVAGNTAGALLVERPDGVRFQIGSGLTEHDREYFWENRVSLIGTLIRYKAFAIGEKDAPRFPVFLGIRSARDL